MNEEKENEVVETNETPVEEVATNEEAQVTEEKPVEPEEAPKLEVDTDYESSPLEKIEENRTTLLKKYRRRSVMKTVVSVVGIMIIAAAFLIVPNLTEKTEIRISVMVVSGVLAVVGMFLYNFLSKRSLNKEMKTYFHTYYGSVTDYSFADVIEKENVTCNVDEKITEDEFKNNNLWKDVVQVGSRAATYIKYKDIDLKLIDAAGQIKDGKRMKPIFVGKYIITKTSYSNENPIIIYLKGDKRAIPPTNVDGIKCVFDDNKMSIYSNNSQWSRFVTKKVKDTLGKLKTKNDLIDVSISIQAGVAYICLGYDDSLMILPLEQPLNARPIKQFKRDLVPTLDFVELINK